MLAQYCCKGAFGCQIQPWLGKFVLAKFSQHRRLECVWKGQEAGGRKVFLGRGGWRVGRAQLCAPFPDGTKQLRLCIGGKNNKMAVQGTPPSPKSLDKSSVRTMDKWTILHFSQAGAAL